MEFAQVVHILFPWWLKYMLSPFQLVYLHLVFCCKRQLELPGLHISYEVVRYLRFLLVWDLSGDVSLWKPGLPLWGLRSPGSSTL